MKKHSSVLPTSFLISSVLFAYASCFAQTPMDTIKPGKANDPMTVNPGKGNDAMAVKPAKPNDGMSTMSDAAFINKNIADNRMEIRLSTLGRDKGNSAEVKKIAALMVNDHIAILNDLESLAKRQRKAQNVPKEMVMPPTSFPEGKEFDKAWAGKMLAMHEAKIEELETFVGFTKDAELKAAVMKAIPKIKMHRNLLLKIPGAKDKSVSSPTI